MGDQAKTEQRQQTQQQQPSPHTPQPPASESRRAGAEAADEHMGPSSEGDTAPESTLTAAGGTEHAQFHSHIPLGFSLVVNDVDADKSCSSPEELQEEKAAMERGGFGVEVVVAVECDPPPEEQESIESGEEVSEEVFRRTLTHSSSQKELSDARIKQIQGEVESRKNEFARLLEEHAQVVKQLKAMEEEEVDGRMGRQQLH